MDEGMMSADNNSVILSATLIESFNQGLQLAKWNNSHRRRPTIYRVPSLIRDVDPEAYEPKVISIGPYHSKKPNLAAMETIKWRYLQNFLSRNSGESRLEEYLKEMKKMEGEVRIAYWDKEVLGSDDFVRMMLLDSCFIVEFLLQWFLDSERDHEAATRWEDPVRGTKWSRLQIIGDMLLLENQLPFFLIERVFHFLHPSGNLASLMTVPLFIYYDDLILYPNRKAFEDDYIIETLEYRPDSDSIHHFLHLCHILVVGKELHRGTEAAGNLRKIFSVVQNFQGLYKINRNKSTLGSSGQKSHRLISALSGRKSELGDESKLHRKLEDLLKFLSHRVNASLENNNRIQNATQLRDAGIRFRKKTETRCVLDVSFRNGRIEIPQLHLYDKTNSILRNLTAFEQCYTEIKCTMSAYCLFFDFLVDTQDDVTILQKEGIIMSHLGCNDDLALLFNRMCKGLTVSIQNSYLRDMFIQVNKYAATRTHRWRAKLNKDYFGNPWAILSFIAAVLLLLLTAAQAIVGIIPLVLSAQ